MIVRVKEANDENFIEIDLGVDEIENITKGRYPAKQNVDINGKSYTISVGLET